MRTSGYGGKDEQSPMPEFTKWTPDGHLRHSSFAGLRDDKDPLLIVRESALAERNPYESVTTSRRYLHRLILAQLKRFQPRFQ